MKCHQVFIKKTMTMIDKEKIKYLSSINDHLFPLSADDPPKGALIPEPTHINSYIK